MDHAGKIRVVTARLKRWLYAAGTVLFLLSLAYGAAFAAHNWHALVALSHPAVGPLFLAGGLYGLTHASSSAGWILGLRGLGHEISFASGLRFNMTAQIGKYLPGNLAHYFARAGLAKAAGIRLTSSGIATLLEVLATVLAAVLATAVAAMFDPAPLSAVHFALANAAILPLVLAGVAVLGAVVFLRLMKVPAGALVATTANLVVSFVLAGLSFLCVVTAVSTTLLSPVAAIGIFAVAFAAGYVVPGAPAGLGVREAILVVWLGPIIGGGPALAATLLHRIISALVDALVALLGLGWLRLTSNAL